MYETHNVIVFLFFSKLCVSYNISSKPFPSDFEFGVATSAYQIEGGWNQSGKGEGTWDYITHAKPQYILDKSNGDVTCDSFHKIDEDIRLLKDLGVNFYRFSISWSRIIPTGNVSQGVNLAGVDYYLDLLKKLKHNRIEAMVTIFHFDLPKSLMTDLFINENFNELYIDFARLAFELFGRYVKYWITFNEPKNQCCSFLESILTKTGKTSYICAHNVIKCHAKVYRMYQSEFKEEFEGQVGITLDTNWNIPATDLEADKEASERKILFEFGWFAHPLVFGDYPAVMKKRVASYSIPFFSRLPKFTDDEKEFMKGAIDFLGVNHYTSCLVTDSPNNEQFRTFEKDLGIKLSYDASWEKTSLSWLYVVPFGIRKLLKWVDETYKYPIFITENGYVENGITLNDERRIFYYQNYLSNVLDAIYIDKVNLKGYSTWSLMDNWEWTNGYTQKFGLYSVNFSSPNRERIPKKSVSYFKKILGTKCLVDECQ